MAFEVVGTKAVHPTTVRRCDGSIYSHAMAATRASHCAGSRSGAHGDTASSRLLGTRLAREASSRTTPTRARRVAVDHTLRVTKGPPPLIASTLFTALVSD